METLLGLFAGMAAALGDVFAVAAAVGSTWVLGVIIVNAVFGTRFKFLSQLEGTLIGLFVGTLGSVSLVLTGEKAEQIGMVFRLSQLTIGILLLLSFVMLIIAFVVKRRFSKPN